MIGELNKRKYLFIAAGILFFFYVIDSDLLQSSGYVFEVIHSINNFGTANFIIPVVCSLPGVLDFYSDKEDKIYRYKVIRIGRMNYTLRSIVKAMLYGGGVMLLSLIALSVTFIVITLLQGNPISFEDMSGVYGPEGGGTIYVKLLEAGYGWVVLLLNYLMMTLNGSLWPCFGIAVSALVKNKKIAVVSPFLLYRIFAYVYDFNEYLTPLPFNMTLSIVYEPWGGFLRVLIYLLVVVILSALVIWGNLQYRYKKGD
jgi:hypothetical protein